MNIPEENIHKIEMLIKKKDSWLTAIQLVDRSGKVIYASSLM